MAGRVNHMSLKQFMLRQDVLSLYRKLFRAIRSVPDESNRKELQDWVRNDFRNNMHHKDEHAIKSLLQHGRTFLEELQRSLSMSR